MQEEFVRPWALLLTVSFTSFLQIHITLELNKKGRLPGQLRKPTDLYFIDSETLVVTEGKNSRLQIFGRGSHKCIDR